MNLYSVLVFCPETSQELCLLVQSDGRQSAQYLALRITMKNMERPGQKPARNIASLGDVMRLRLIENNGDLRCGVWQQDMDGKMFHGDNPEEDGKYVVMTEACYEDIVRRMRQAGISKI